MGFGVIEYNPQGLPKCELCGQAFKRVLSHVRQKHFMTEREYKLMFGFDLSKGIISHESREKSRDAALANYDVVIAKNLLENGITSRFKPGCNGRTVDMVSEQTRLALKSNLNTPKMREVARKNGKAMGLSGLGNAKRWRK